MFLTNLRGKPVCGAAVDGSETHVQEQGPTDGWLDCFLWSRQQAA